MKRGQISLEQVILYGTAILVVLTAIGVVIYFDVFDTSKLLPDQCSFQAEGFLCEDWTAYADPENKGYIEVLVLNNVGSTISVDGIVRVDEDPNANMCTEYIDPSNPSSDCGTGSGKIPFCDSEYKPVVGNDWKNGEAKKLIFGDCLFKAGDRTNFHYEILYRLKGTTLMQVAAANVKVATAPVGTISLTVNNICGDGKIGRDSVTDVLEQCDGFDFGAKNCASSPYNNRFGGHLTCKNNCIISDNTCTGRSGSRSGGGSGGGGDIPSAGPLGSSCGIGNVDSGEECDDNNQIDGDGCSSCFVDQGWGCETNTDGRSECSPVCGDGTMVGDETCDPPSILNCDANCHIIGSPVLDPIGDKTINAGETFTLTLTATDPDDNDVLTYSMTSSPELAAATFSDSNGELIWTPSNSDEGKYSVIFTVTDTTGLTDSETITITVKVPCEEDSVCTAINSDYTCQAADSFCDYHCGNDYDEPQYGETCEDGNRDNGDGCSFPSCTLSLECTDGEDNDDDNDIDFADDDCLDADGNGNQNDNREDSSNCDNDGDGYKDPNAYGLFNKVLCGGYQGNDCNDYNYYVNPAAVEIPCDGINNDCNDDTLDEPDADGDGYPERCPNT